MSPGLWKGFSRLCRKALPEVFEMKAMEKGTLPSQKEAIVKPNDGISRFERVPPKSEVWKKAEGVEDREVPDHIYATYWG
jgi:hypothetical protein